MSEAKQTQGMRIFTLIWLGQVVSLIGSGLTGFALGVWVYKQTGSATQFTWISLSTLLPGLLISPLAGVLVDRWNRRWIIIVCDLLAALTTFVVFWTIQSDHLTIWLMCLAAAIYSILDAFQRPAYSVLTTLLVPEKRLAQASGMTQAAQALSQLIAPILAGLLLVYFQLQTVVLIDFFTFVFALATVLSVRFDGASAKPAASKQSLWQEMRFGWDYLKDQPALRDLMVFFASGNFLMSAAGILLTPLVLSFSHADALGTILSGGGVGRVVGGGVGC